MCRIYRPACRSDLFLGNGTIEGCSKPDCTNKTADFDLCRNTWEKGKALIPKFNLSPGNRSGRETGERVWKLANPEALPGPRLCNWTDAHYHIILLRCGPGGHRQLSRKEGGEVDIDSKNGETDGELLTFDEAWDQAIHVLKIHGTCERVET